MQQTDTLRVDEKKLQQPAEGWGIVTLNDLTYASDESVLCTMFGEPSTCVQSAEHHVLRLFLYPF